MFNCLWFSDTPCFIYFSDKTILDAHVFLNKHQIKWSIKIKFNNRSVDRASATKTVDAGSIPGRVKIPGCPLSFFLHFYSFFNLCHFFLLSFIFFSFF